MNNIDVWSLLILFGLCFFMVLFIEEIRLKQMREDRDYFQRTTERLRSRLIYLRDTQAEVYNQGLHDDMLDQKLRDNALFEMNTLARQDFESKPAPSTNVDRVLGYYKL